MKKLWRSRRHNAGEVQDLHKVSEVICLCCLHRWIAVRPVGTLLIELECPKCHEQGATIETGEELEEVSGDV